MGWEEFRQSFLNFASLGEVMPLLLQGFALTLLLIVAIVPAAMLGGLLIAVLHSFGIPVLRQALIVYIDFLRSFPPLVLLIFLYSGLPFIGVRLSEFNTVVFALVANGSAFFGEIFRAGIESVPRGQREAARSTGIGAINTMVFVVLPQGIRNVIPPLASNVIELSKATSLAAVVALPDLLRNARAAQDIVYNPTPLVAAAAIYLACFWPLVRLLSRLEQRMIAAQR
jgi:polar amino acid transport system permease protein